MAYRVLDDYPRRPHLEFYRRYPNPFYSASFELDATLVRERARQLGASTYAALVWCFHRALLQIDAFRTRLVGEDVVLHDGLRVGMTVPAPGRLFSFANLDWDADPERYLAAARREIAVASAAVDLTGGAAPDFAYYTALPQVPFTSFAHVPLADPTAGQPETAFGRFRADGERSLVPVGVQVNHLYVDGADLGELFEARGRAFCWRFDERIKPRIGAWRRAVRMATKRTTHRSSAGKKLYAVRDGQGRFTDIQTYERAHRADLAKKSGAEKKSDAARAAKSKKKK